MKDQILIWNESNSYSITLHTNEQRGKSLPTFRCNPENRGLLLASATLDAVLGSNTNPNAKASLLMRLVPVSTAHCAHQSGKGLNDLASVTLQLLPAGNHRGGQKCNFLNLPKLDNTLQDPAGGEKNIQRILNLQVVETFPIYDQRLGTFLEKKKKRHCLWHHSFSGVLYSLLQIEAHIY